MIAIVIRTYNESAWLHLCLKSILLQEVDHEIQVFLIDSESTDNTLRVAKSFKEKMNLTIQNYEGNYLPGKSLNMGVLTALDSKADYITILSAHCVLQGSNALNNMVKALTKNHNVRSVFGRQLPVNFSDAIAWRDMVHMYPNESRVITSHPSLNNAFSMYKAEALSDHIFNQHVTNLEDVFWAKEELELGWFIYYEGQAAVSHYHGPNHKNDPKRLNTSVDVIRENKEVFDAKIADLGITSEDFLGLYFTTDIEKLKENTVLVLSRDLVVCTYDDASIIEYCMEKSLPFLIRPRKNTNESLYAEFPVIQRLILEEIGSFVYIMIYDDSLDENLKVLGAKDMIEIVENSYPDIVWGIVESSDYLISSRNGTNFSLNNAKKRNLVIKRGNGCLFKFAAMTDYQNIAFETIRLK